MLLHYHTLALQLQKVDKLIAAGTIGAKSLQANQAADLALSVATLKDIARIAA